MFCSKCGKEFATSDPFCSGCGSQLGGQPNNQWLTVLKGVAIAAIIVIGALTGLNYWASPKTQPRAETTMELSTAPSLFPKMFTVPHTFTVASGPFQVKAGQALTFPLNIDLNLTTNPHLTGRFSAVGGSGNDIIVLVLDDEQRDNWVNRHSTSTYFNSGKITTGDVEFAPTVTGKYFLAFDNRFSLLSDKQIFGTITLNWTTQELTPR